MIWLRLIEQQESQEKGRRKLEFNKDKRQQKERLKGFVVFVDVPNAPAKLKEIKERVVILGGVRILFFWYLNLLYQKYFKILTFFCENQSF